MLTSDVHHVPVDLDYPLTPLVKSFDPEGTVEEKDDLLMPEPIYNKPVKGKKGNKGVNQKKSVSSKRFTVDDEPAETEDDKLDL